VCLSLHVLVVHIRDYALHPKCQLAGSFSCNRHDALGIHDVELMDKVGGRLFARCLDVIAITDSLVHCPVCLTEFHVPWIGQAAERTANCRECAWSITVDEFHASFEHQDLLAINAREAVADFVDEYVRAERYAARMLAVDRLVHAVHASGNTVVRNLVEGRPRQVLAILDELAARRG
jgi:hypothetical protein